MDAALRGALPGIPAAEPVEIGDAIGDARRAGLASRAGEPGEVSAGRGTEIGEPTESAMDCGEHRELELLPNRGREFEFERWWAAVAFRPGTAGAPLDAWGATGGVAASDLLPDVAWRRDFAETTGVWAWVDWAAATSSAPAAAMAATVGSVAFTGADRFLRKAEAVVCWWPDARGRCADDARRGAVFLSEAGETPARVGRAPATDARRRERLSPTLRASVVLPVPTLPRRWLDDRAGAGFLPFTLAKSDGLGRALTDTRRARMPLEANSLGPFLSELADVNLLLSTSSRATRPSPTRLAMFPTRNVCANRESLVNAELVSESLESNDVDARWCEKLRQQTV